MKCNYCHNEHVRLYDVVCPFSKHSLPYVSEKRSFFALEVDFPKQEYLRTPTTGTERLIDLLKTADKTRREVFNTSRMIVGNIPLEKIERYGKKNRPRTKT